MDADSRNLQEQDILIKEIGAASEMLASVAVIRTAFATVAGELNLTELNCPTNPAFLKMDGLTALFEKGLRLFGCFYQEKQIGFLAIEKADAELYYLEKLAVVPELRHQGVGRELLDFGFEYVRAQGGKRISIALIAENERLKQWYSRYGFRETGMKHFPHLPFTVCFMEKGV